jgi:hypothetical protein
MVCLLTYTYEIPNNPHDWTFKFLFYYIPERKMLPIH